MPYGKVIIDGWIIGPGDPADPNYGIPGWGGRPDQGLPGGGHPWLPGHLGGPRPDQGLPGYGHISTGPIYGGGHPGNKPPGAPILPPHADNGLPPNGGAPPHPGWGGRWEVVDPGWGLPPLLAFFPVDPGWGVGVVPPDVIGGGPATPPGLHPGGGPITPPVHPGGGPVVPPARPDAGLPPGATTKPLPKPPGGQWIPVDPSFGQPIRPCPPAGRPHPPRWGWLPDLPHFGGGPAEATVLDPTTATVLASGGQGDIKVSAGPGTWQVTGMPAWVTVSPAGGTANGAIHYTAAANSTGLPRQALLQIAGAQFVLNQGAV